MLRRTKSGQAVLELAIFASFILLGLGVLLQYGMHANFSDNLRMTYFRKAVALARDMGAMNRDSVNPELNLTAVKDKFIPTPGRYFGAADTDAVAAQYNIVYSTRTKLRPGAGAFQNQSRLPRVYFAINEDNPNQFQSYSTAAYTRAGPFPADFLFRIKETASGGEIWWEWKFVTASDKDTSGNYYLNIGTVVWPTDETPVTILSLDRACPTPTSCYVRDAVFLDPGAGEINPYYKTVDGESGVTITQGLQPRYRKERSSNNRVNREENKTGINTQGQIRNAVRVQRTIKTNAGDVPVENQITQNINENFQVKF